MVFHDVKGIFLEVGAFDGITYSNTKTLEDSLKFTGILIEASPSSFENMSQNRPKCKNHNYAISNIDSEYLSFLDNVNSLGGLKRILENTYDKNNRNWIDAWNISREEIKVKVKKLSNVLNEKNIKYIDFFSLDVNGSELDVLESFDWSIPIYVIAINIRAWGKAGKEMVEKCRKLLSSKGFVLDNKTSFDEFWINNEYFRKDLLK
mgnify:CR=1 FL=1